MKQKNFKSNLTNSNLFKKKNLYINRLSSPNNFSEHISPQVSQLNTDYDYQRLHHSRSSFFKKSVDVNRSSFERQHQLLEEKIQQYMSASLIDKLHDRVIGQIKCMPNEVIQYLKTNYSVIQHSYESAEIQSKLQLDLEYELIEAMKNIENQIIKNIFINEFIEKQDYSQNFQEFKPKISFNIQMIPLMVQLLNNSISKAIKFYNSTMPKIAHLIENHWKMFVFFIDQCLSFCQTRHSLIIDDALKQAEKKYQEQASHLKSAQARYDIVNQQHQQEIKENQAQYKNLKEQYDNLNQKYRKLEEQLTEDTKYIAKGGLNQMKKNIEDFQITLDNLDKRVQISSMNVFGSLKSVGTIMVNKNKHNPTVQKIRQLLGINSSLQAPIDMAFSSMVSEHPWIPYLLYKNIQLPQIQSVKTLSKIALLHEFLTKSYHNNLSPTQILIQQNDGKNIEELIVKILEIVRIEPQKEENQISRPIRLIFDRVFNLYDREGLDFHYLKIFQQFYISLLTSLNNDYNNDAIVDIQSIVYDPNLFKITLSPESINQVLLVLNKLIHDENDIHYILTSLDNINQEYQFTEFLHIICEVFYKLSNENFNQRLKKFQFKLQNIINVEDFLSKIIAQQIIKNIFPEYKWIDTNQLWNYLIWRFYTFFDKQINYDSGIKNIIINLEIQQKINIFNKNINHQIIINQFFPETIVKIKTLLKFNSNAFGKIDDQIKLDYEIKNQELYQNTNTAKQIVNSINKQLGAEKLLGLQKIIQSIKN